MSGGDRGTRNRTYRRRRSANTRESLDVHHNYDPLSRVLYMGDGSRRSATGQGVSGTFTDVFGGPGSGLNLQNSGSTGFTWLDDGSLYCSTSRGRHQRASAPNLP